MKNCVVCSGVIPAGRLEVLPHTKVCVKCADRVPDGPSHSWDHIVSQSSAAGRNGFAKSD